MHKLKNNGVVLLAVIGLLALSGVAMAEEHDDDAQSDSNDTVFNYGYDEENQFLIWNITSLDYQPDTEAMEDALAQDFDALLEACSLAMEGDDGPLVDGYSLDGETLTLTKGGEAVTDLPEECGEFDGGEVTGPNGQVNHGMFMKLFNELYDGAANRGCLVRHLAQSDLGKGEQKVKAGDVDLAEEETGGEVIEGSVDFTTIEADCQRGKKGDDDEDGGGGPPQHVLDKWAEKWPDGKPGKGNK